MHPAVQDCDSLGLFLALAGAGLLAQLFVEHGSELGFTLSLNRSAGRFRPDGASTETDLEIDEVLEELRLAQKVVEAFHRVGKLFLVSHAILLTADDSEKLTFFCSIASLFLPISEMLARRSSFATLRAFD